MPDNKTDPPGSRVLRKPTGSRPPARGTREDGLVQASTPGNDGVSHHINRVLDMLGPLFAASAMLPETTPDGKVLMVVEGVRVTAGDIRALAEVRSRLISAGFQSKTMEVKLGSSTDLGFMRRK